MGMPYPRWINSMPNSLEKLRAMNRFRMRLAALYASPDGSLAEMSSIINVSYDAIKSQAQSERCLASQHTREGIRKLLGDDFVPPPPPPNCDWSNLS